MGMPIEQSRAGSSKSPPPLDRRTRGTWLNLAMVALLGVVVAPSSPAATVTVTYSYDQLGRLVESTYGMPLRITYQWDANGNLIRRTVVGPRVRRAIRAAEIDQLPAPAGAALAPPLPPVRSAADTPRTTTDPTASRTPSSAANDEEPSRGP